MATLTTTKENIDQILEDLRVRLYAAVEAQKPIEIDCRIGVLNITKPTDMWERHAPDPYRFSCRIDIGGGAGA